VINFIYTLFSFLFAISLVVGFHEFGHYVTARLLGIKVLRFSIGMGKVVFQKTSKKSGIEYSLSLLPIGGYVEMLDENSLRKDTCYTEDELKKSFNRAPLWKRSLIVMNGPLFNGVLALIIYFAMGLSGYSYYKPYVGRIASDSWAKTQGFNDGDLIKTISDVSLRDWPETAQVIASNIGSKNVEIIVLGKDKTERKLSADFSQVALSRHDTDLFGRIGLVPAHTDAENFIGEVLPLSPAEKSGLKSGDQILDIDHIKITNFSQIRRYIATHPGKEILVTYIRNGISKSDKIIVSGKNKSNDVGLIGITPQNVEIKKEWVGFVNYSVIDSFKLAISQVISTISTTYLILWKLITGGLSFTLISGPIGIAKIAGTTAMHGTIAYFSFIALLNVNLMIMNLLPIPVLDGGHLIQYVIEGVFNIKISENFIKKAQKTGYILLMTMISFAVIMDLIDLF